MNTERLRSLANMHKAIGDIDAMHALLCDVTHIGKKCSQGYGRVNQWIIEPWPDQWWLYDNRGKLNR